MRNHTTGSIPAWVVAVAATLAAMPLAAADRVNPGGPIVQRAMLASLVRHCSETYPKLAPALNAKLDAWNTEHADDNTAADAFIAGLSPDNRAKVDRAVRATEQSAIEMLDAARRQVDGEAFCAEIFEGFGSTGSEGYYDADSLDEAMGMYFMTMRSADIGREMCVARYPHLASPVDEALAEWRRREAPIIAGVESRLDRMEREHPDSVRDLMETAEQTVRRMLSAAIDNGHEVYCRKHFDSLVSGENRRKTPKMYRFLEQEFSAR